MRGPWLLLPQAVRDVTLELLASFGSRRQRHEGVVYWLGVEATGPAAVLQAVAPEATTGPGFFRTTATNNAAVIGAACEAGLALVAQVHSHPGDWAEHSHGDDELALKPYKGVVSVVVPHYARGDRDPASWGVYRWTGDRFEPPPSDSTPILLVPTLRDLRRDGRRRRRVPGAR